MIKKKIEEEDNSWVQGPTVPYLFVRYNRTVLRHKTTTKLLIFVFSLDSNNKLNDLIVGSHVRNRSHVNDIHSGIKPNTEVSNM